MLAHSRTTPAHNDAPLLHTPVNAIDRRALVVPSQHEKILRVLDLVREEQADALQSLRPTVYVVPQKEIVGLGREASVFKEAQQVGVPGEHELC